MNTFRFISANNTKEAAEAAAIQNQKIIAGGTNLVDLMRLSVEHPAALVEISRLPITEIKELPNGNLSIGALVTNSEIADHKIVRQQFPVLARAILSGASQQIRNVATAGGNLLQRTRCNYFFDTDRACNKRNPGAGCSAIEGYNRMHAIFGASESCVAVHPSDMCVAFAALGAAVKVFGKKGSRDIPFADFHRLPENTPQIETNLASDEIVTGIEIPADARKFAANSYYRKVRDRASFAFALVSVAALLEMKPGGIKQARLAMGGVAHKPWRSAEAEMFLAGKTPSEKIFNVAAEMFMRGAKPLAGNAFKIEMGKRNIVRALLLAAKI